MKARAVVNEIQELVSLLRSDSWVIDFKNMKEAPYFSSFKFNDLVYAHKLPWKKGIRLYVTIKEGGAFICPSSFFQRQIVVVDGTCWVDNELIPKYVAHLTKPGQMIQSPTGAHLIVDLLEKSL